MMSRLSSVAALLGGASIALAATPIPNIIPFAVTGALDGCTPDGTEYNAGGSMSVNGFNIKAPKNLITQFPVAWVPFKQLCDEGGALGYEVSVSGNVVNGQAIAAIVSVSAGFSLEGAQGYIEEVNIENAYLKIRGGPIVKINDPEGVYSKGSKQRELFTADTGSPSITSFSGFPMCIPRSASDPKCPSSNRPAGRTVFQAPDPLVMAPFLVGDFIEYSGLKVGGSEILAWAITAINVQITTTASSTIPNYIRVEEGLVGIFDNAAGVEVADMRFIGFVTSCAGTTITVSAIDVDPCTGKETYRQVGTATPRQDQRCRWELRTDTDTASTYTREYLIKANTPVITTKNGIKAGQYVQAVSEWIQVEVDVPGTEPPAYRWRDIRGLVEGDFLDGKQYGPLSPFPGAAPPAPSKQCSPDDIPPPEDPEDPEDPTDPPPTSNSNPVASVAQISAVQRVGASIVLSGSNTAQGIPSSDLVFAWTKTSPSSPAVSIQNAAQPTATFTAPTVTTETSFVFELKVSLKSDSTKSSKATVTVKVSPTKEDVVTLDTYTWVSRQSGTLSVTCHSNVVNGDNKKMSLLLNNGATTLAMTGAGQGKWSYSSRDRSRPTNVQCVSDLKGKSAVVSATTSRRRRGELGLELEG